MLEVHVLDGATNYQTFLLHIATPIGAADAATNMTFALGDFNGDGIPDLFAFKHSNTGTGMLEVHVLNGATNYQTFLLNTGTPIGEADAAANFTFAVGDFNRDGIPDVFGFKHSGTGTGSMEVHVLNGAANYQTFLLNTGTSISQTDAATNFSFSLGDFNLDTIPDVIAQSSVIPVPAPLRSTFLTEPSIINTLSLLGWGTASVAVPSIYQPDFSPTSGAAVEPLFPTESCLILGTYAGICYYFSVLTSRHCQVKSSSGGLN
jgi:tellurite resistance-related uncharacterized protein